MLTIKRLSQSDAELILAAAEARARAMSVPQNIAVTDESGHLIAFRRMDGAAFTAIEMAINKAFTAAGTGRATHLTGPAAAHPTLICMC